MRIIKIVKEDNVTRLKVNILGIFTILGVALPLLFFAWFNTKSYANPLQFSGTVGSVEAIDESGKPTIPKLSDPRKIQQYLNPEEQHKDAVNFFKSRRLLNGFNLQFLSPDRGIVVFTPVILFGIFGTYLLYRSRNKYLALLVGIVGANIFLYALWGDPWGGWAFGSRYLIPSYGVMSIFIAIALTRLNKKWLFMLIFYIALIYSVGVNTLGAITTNENPPQVEALPLEKLTGKQERYSFDRNWDYLNTSGTKSFVYSVFAKKYIKPLEYYYLTTGAITIFSTSLFVVLVFNKNEKP